MWTFSLGTSVAIPFSKTVTEEKSAGITTTTTDTSSMYTTWSLWPTFCYVFKPKIAPVYTIYSIYLSDTFGMQFYPDHLSTTKISNGKEEGWKDRSQSYITNNFYGYADGQHYISTIFLIRWRAQFGLYSIFEEYGNTKTKDTSGTVTEEKISRESYTMWPYVGGWIGFTYQAIPSFLSLTGAVQFPIVGANAMSWWFQHTKTTYADADFVSTEDYSGFYGFYTQFTLGAAVMLNSNVTFELGTVMDANTKKTGLNAVSLTLKYKN
jgi:hypothetical protein